MQITAAILAKIVGKRVNANMTSIEASLAKFGAQFGLDKPHRMAHFLAQLAHESGGFHYDKEVWGPTAAQARYDNRADLGNTPESDGDGELYKGRGPIQITGKSNYRQFTDWCHAQGLDAPNFVAHPELVNVDPWEGLGPIWYWTTRKLNDYADDNDIEQITKKINGGLNGFADRIGWYTKAALTLAGYQPHDVTSFQIDAQRAGLLPAGAEQVDGDAGPKTRAALHKWLAQSQPVTAPVVETKASPVTEAVPVAPKGADKTLLTRVSSGVAILAPAAPFFLDFDQTGKFIMLGVGIAAVLILLLRGEQIAARVKAVVKSFEAVS